MVQERPPSTLRIVDATTEVEDVDDGPLGGAGGRSDNGYHRS
jgi:hypothetical protein